MEVLDKLTYAGNPANLVDIGVELRRATSPTPDAVGRAAAGCDAIVNFAAETHVDRSILELAGPDRDERDRRADPARMGPRRRADGSSTSPPTRSTATSRRGGSSEEDDPLRPSSPYSAAKAAGDLQVIAYVRTYDVDAVVTRGSNTYGPNQYPEKLLPLFVTNALDGEPLPVYGDGRQVRDWLFVEDHCAAIDAVLRDGRRGEVYNIGGGDERENREITRMVVERPGADPSLVKHVEDRAGHDRRYSLDSSKIEAELGWRPAVTLDDGLERTVAWYRENRDWWEPIKQSGGYREYYEQQYAARLRA